MFKLLHTKTKWGRGIKILAERTYIGIGLMGFKLAGTDDRYSSDVTLEVWSDTSRDRYMLIIPDDQIDSVCERLQEAKAKKARNAKVVADRS